MSRGITPAAPEGELTWVAVKSVAPAAGAVQADTGALPAGLYHFTIQVCVAGAAAAGKGLFIEHRDAANGATQKDLGGIGAPGQDQILLQNYRLALNERLRIVNGIVGAAGEVFISAIGRQKVE